MEDKKPFSFNMFVTALGYHGETKNGERVFVKNIDKRRQSIISKEILEKEYMRVCKKLINRQKE